MKAMMRKKKKRVSKKSKISKHANIKLMDDDSFG